MDKRIGFGLKQSCGNRRMLDVCLCCGSVGGKWIGILEQGLEEWGCVMSVVDPLCRLQVQVSVYCARRIPAHLRFT